MLLTAVSCLTSCVRDVVLDAGEDPQVVVECVLKNSDVQELRLNYTKGASKMESEPLTDAVATLTDLTLKMEVGQFKRKEGDLWTLYYSPIPYHDYRLEVQVPGHELIYAEETMPGQLYFRWGWAGSDNPGGLHADSHQQNKGNFEKIKNKYPDNSNQLAFIRGSLYMLEKVPHPFLIYGMNYNPLTKQYEMVEELCTDHPAVLSCTLNGGTYVPPSIKEELPRVQLHPYLEGAALHNRYLIFPKGSDQIEEYFVISGSFTGVWFNPYNVSPIRGYLVFASLSDNYMQYLNQAVQIKAMKESSDMSVIYLRDNVFSNINGGLGLFGAFYENQVEWIKTYLNINVWENFWYEYERAPSQFYPSPLYPDKFYYIDENGNYCTSVNDRDGLYEWYESGLLTWDEYMSIGGI